MAQYEHPGWCYVNRANESFEKIHTGVVNRIKKGDFISGCGTHGLQLENYV